jgi:hypothetical protein
MVLNLAFVSKDLLLLMWQEKDRESFVFIVSQAGYNNGFWGNLDARST